MGEHRVMEMLKSCDALLEGHFRYTSGRHGRVYFEKIRIVQRPALVDELGTMMARTCADLAGSIDVVCAPAFGAIVFGFSTALHMDRPFGFLQRDQDGVMGIRSGFTNAVAGRRVLLVEDVCTTGGSLRESIDALKRIEAEVVCAGLIVDRTGGALDIGVPYRALLTVKAESWPPEDCLLCTAGIPMSTPGSSGKRPD
jgi:orotate phosphoribosyltransferase